MPMSWAENDMYRRETLASLAAIYPLSLGTGSSRARGSVNDSSEENVCVSMFDAGEPAPLAGW